MSRSGYVDDYDDDDLSLGRWRGQVSSAIRGKRGQAFLKEMARALDAMPVKELIAEELELDGEVCAIGAVGKARGLNMAGVDPEESEVVAEMFGIARPMVCEIVYENDEHRVWEFNRRRDETPAERWERMRRWVEKHIAKEEPHENH